MAKPSIPTHGYEIANYNTRSYPAPPQVESELMLLVVLVRRVEGYKCYGAIVPSIHAGSPLFPDFIEWTATNGQTLSFAEARSHFPALPQERYTV